MNDKKDSNEIGLGCIIRELFESVNECNRESSCFVINQHKKRQQQLYDELYRRERIYVN